MSRLHVSFSDLIRNIRDKPPLMLRLLFSFVLSLLALMVAGQPKDAAELRRTLNKATSDSEKVEALNELSSSYYDFNADTGYHFAKEASALAVESNYQKGLRLSRALEGYYFFVKGKYQQAYRLYLESLHVKIPKDPNYAYTLVLLGNLYRTTSKYDSAELMYKKAIAVQNDLKSEVYMPYALKSQARLYALQWRNDEAEKAFNEALAIYEKRGNPSGMADTWLSLAEVKKHQAKMAEAASYINKACDLPSSTEDDFQILNCLMAHGNLFYQNGDYPKALRKYIEALAILKSRDMPLRVQEVYNSIADVYRALGENDFALRYYSESLRICESIGINFEIGRTYGDMASVYLDKGDLKKANDLLEKSTTIRKTIRDEFGLSYGMNLRGLIAKKQGRYDDAIASLQQALEIRRKIGFREGEASTLYNLSTVYAQQGNYKKARQLEELALGLTRKTGNLYFLGYSYNRLAQVYLGLKRYEECERYLKAAEVISKQIDSDALVMNNQLTWSKLKEVKGTVGEAFRYFKQYVVARDSIYNGINSQKLGELQALYMMERKDFEIALLRQERIIKDNQIELQQSKINEQYTVIIAVVIGLIMVSLLLIVTFRLNGKIRKANREITEQKEEIQAQSEELVDANQTIAEINKKLEEKIEIRTEALSQAYKELDTFFYRSSHDFRRPLTTFLGLAEVAKVTVKDPNALELFDKVKETAHNLDKMLVKLQSISDVGSQQLVYKEVLLKELFDSVCDTFRSEIHRKHITTSCDIRIKDAFISYPAMVHIIMENLVENAIQFCGTEKPFIRFTAVQTSDYITLELQDNGQGIPKEFHDQVFDMYFRGNERSKGNGLGLYIVKKAVQKLDGSVSFSSIIMGGTTFTVMLPIRQGRA